MPEFNTMEPKKQRAVWSRVIFSGEPINSWLVNLALTILRVSGGLGIAFLHGLSKFPPSDAFVGGLDAKGFPLPYVCALLAALGELLGGLSIALGLATRVGALVLLVNMSVAFFLFHGSDPLAKTEPALTYLIFALVFLLIGGCRFSVDALIRRVRQ